MTISQWSSLCSVLTLDLAVLVVRPDEGGEGILPGLGVLAALHPAGRGLVEAAGLLGWVRQPGWVGPRVIRDNRDFLWKLFRGLGVTTEEGPLFPVADEGLEFGDVVEPVEIVHVGTLVPGEAGAGAAHSLGDSVTHLKERERFGEEYKDYSPSAGDP